jgi:small subunit ribosomal protein S8e
MARSQARSKRKYTGKKYKNFRKKRKRELERPTVDAQIGADKKKMQRVMGGNYKYKLFSSQYINVTDQTTNKTTKEWQDNLKWLPLEELKTFKSDQLLDGLLYFKSILSY